MLNPVCHTFLSHETSKIIQSTEHIHKFAIDFTTNTVDFVIQHDTPYPIRYAVVHALQDFATYREGHEYLILSKSPPCPHPKSKILFFSPTKCLISTALMKLCEFRFLFPSCRVRCDISFSS